MRYMWKFFLLLMLVVTSCSEKQIDGNVINVAEAVDCQKDNLYKICFPA